MTGFCGLFIRLVIVVGADAVIALHKRGTQKRSQATIERKEVKKKNVSCEQRLCVNAFTHIKEKWSCFKARNQKIIRSLSYASNF